jgi:putative ABC transport system permease protein
LAAAKPALDAARTMPAQVLRRMALERGAHRGARRGALVAMPLLAVSGLTLAFGPDELYVAFAGLFAVLAAGALLTPAATILLMRGVDWAVGRRLRLPALMAVRGVSASLSRTGVATAALAVAIATVNGVGLMITSFRGSLGDWLDSTLTADLYVGFDGTGHELTDSLLRSIEGIDGVLGLSLTRTILVPATAGAIAVRAVRPGARGWGLVVVDGEPGAVFAALAAGRGILASERLMFARKLRVGDVVVLPTPLGEQELPILGAYRDFNTGSYSVVLALERYRRDWMDSELTGIGVDLDEGADAAAAEAALGSILAGETGIRIRSSRGIEQLSLEVFDRTFKITEVLRVLAAIVAFLGVLSALLAIELERAHELGVLRALGFSPRGIATNLLTQTGLLGAAAGLIAMPIGTALAALLVHVINRRSFGWSMSFALTPGPLAAGFLLAVAAALLAGLYPSWRASRVELAMALREE